VQFRGAVATFLIPNIFLLIIYTCETQKISHGVSLSYLKTLREFMGHSL